MKKFLIIIVSIVAVVLLFDIAYFRLGWYIDFQSNKEVETFIKTDDSIIYIDKGNGYEPFEVKGVNMGSGQPGKWATDFSIDKSTYLRWFKYIKEMGANTIRIYTIQNDTFYKAFYEYNKDNPDPLYLIHGVWLNDYILNSHRDAYNDEFYDVLRRDSKIVVDVIHGKRRISPGEVNSSGSGNYFYDISKWVIGYIVGVEWEDLTVAYTDDKYSGKSDFDSYQGQYMYTSDEATPFEAMLCRVGDEIIKYESVRYKKQRLVAFSNWPTTDPFKYPANVSDYFMKCAYIDVEHIKTTDDFISGQFASYHVYPYYPDYLNYMDDWTSLGIEEKSEFEIENGGGYFNTYRAYLTALARHHTMPVVISEFGVSTGRGMAQRDANTGRSQGQMSEREQGQALIDCYNDIMTAGCAGSCIFSWQDEWFKRTWNTMYAVDLSRTPYWSDYQTNEQYFGLLSFDPCKERSVCYVDGDISEWTEDDIVSQNEGMTLSMKYDERFIYFLIHKPELDFKNDTVYVPVDVTPKSGSLYCKDQDLLLERAADFLIVISGADNSRILVQERYEALRSTYSQNIYDFDTYVKSNVPDKDSPIFVPINMILQTATVLLYNDLQALAETFETGILRYGNANPESEDFDSLADFICSGDYIELKLPWQLLNFADPSHMMIHDDYYDGNYGVEYIHIDELYVGIGSSETEDRVKFYLFKLDSWGDKLTYHERLKSSYYIMKECWTAK